MRKEKINGKSIAQIEEELAVDFPENAFKPNKANGKIYLPYERFKERLDSVIGLFNYSIYVSESTELQIGSQEVVCVKMMLTVYDDEGSVCIVRSSNGACPVTILQKNGNPKSYKSNVKSAEHEAFKEICKSLKIAIRQIESLNPEEEDDDVRETRRTIPADYPLTDVMVEVTFDEKIRDVGGRLVCKGVDSEGREVEFIAFGERYSEISKCCSVEKLIENSGKGKSMTFLGRYKPYGGRLQLQFRSFAAKS